MGLRWPGFVGLAVSVVLIIALSFGPPSSKEFRKDSYEREASHYLPGDIPPDTRAAIVAKCQRELQRGRRNGGPD